MPDFQIAVAAPPDMTCEEARNRLAVGGLDPDEEILVTIKMAHCSAQRYNDAHKDDPQPKSQIVYATPDKDDPRKVAFGLLSSEDAANVNAICKIALTAWVGSEVPGAGEVLQASFGSYVCDSYYEAALRNDPMLIIFPGLIPGEKLNKELLSKAQVVSQTLYAHFKAHPEDILTWGINPQSQANLLVTLGAAVGGDVGKALTNIGQAAGGAITDASNAVGTAAHDVINAVDPRNWHL